MFSIYGNGCIKLWRLHLERVSNIKPFVNKYSWKGIHYSLKTDDWKTFEKNNLTIWLLYINEKVICPGYISEINLSCEKKKKIINDSKRRKKAGIISQLKKISALLGWITSKNHRDFYCLNCFHSFRIANKLKSHEKVCKNKGFCGMVMPSEKNKITEFNQYMKSDKTSYITYADIKYLIKEIEVCANNPKILEQQK